MSKPTQPTTEERLAAALAAFFRSVSGSKDRALAALAIRLEKPVLDIVHGKKRTTKKVSA